MSNSCRPYSLCASVSDAFSPLGWMGLLALGLHFQAAHAQWQVLPEVKPQQVFAGESQEITVRLRNSGAEAVNAELHTRLLQASSATAVPLNVTPWKKLQVLPSQTIIESAHLAFPVVKSETRFLVQWLESTNRVLGKTEVLVYPPDLLKQLKPMIEEESLGVFDPQNEIKPLLRALAVDFQDLVEDGTDKFAGKLAIIGPFESQAQMRESLGTRIEALAAKGVAVVWIQPPPERRDKLMPSFYTVAAGKAAVVIVQAELVADLGERPQSQLNLLHCARLALNPEPARLPHSTLKP